jgi:hypothetical protein
LLHLVKGRDEVERVAIVKQFERLFGFNQSAPECQANGLDILQKQSSTESRASDFCKKIGLPICGQCW